MIIAMKGKGIYYITFASFISERCINKITKRAVDIQDNTVSSNMSTTLLLENDF
jgi:hypothetical protein